MTLADTLTRFARIGRRPNRKKICRRSLTFESLETRRVRAACIPAPEWLDIDVEPGPAPVVEQNQLEIDGPGEGSQREALPPGYDLPPDHAVGTGLVDIASTETMQSSEHPAPADADSPAEQPPGGEDNAIGEARPSKGEVPGKSQGKQPLRRIEVDDEGDKPPKEEAAKRQRTVATLVGQLGSDEFEVRERATARLKQLGKQAEYRVLVSSALNHALANGNDLEVQHRAKHLLDELGRFHRERAEIDASLDKILANRRDNDQFMIEYQKLTALGFKAEHDAYVLSKLDAILGNVEVMATFSNHNIRGLQILHGHVKRLAGIRAGD